MKRVLALLVALLFFAAPARAQSPKILETANFVPSSVDYNGWSDSMFWIGVIDYGGGYYYEGYVAAKLHLDVETDITEVGIANIGSGNFYTGSLYAALVKVGNTGMPEGTWAGGGWYEHFNLDESQVVASAVFTPPSAGQADTRIPLAAKLAAGDYVVLFGSGRFGATGSAMVGTAGQQRIGNPTIRVMDNWWFGLSWVDNAEINPRIVVVGSSSHDALATIVTGAVADARDQIQASVATRASQQSITDLSGALASHSITTTAMLATLTGFASSTQSAMTSATATLGQIQSDVGALTTAVAELGNTASGGVTPAHINALQTALTSEIGTRASHEDVQTLASTLPTAPDALMARIESALAGGIRIATLFLPNNVGGHLDDVRSFVADTLAAAQTAGLDVTRALADLAKGDAALSTMRYRDAYDWYASAYQRLVK